MGLDGDARGVAEVAVLAIQIRPGGGDGFGIHAAMEGLEFVALFAFLRTGFIRLHGVGGALGAGVADAVEARSGVASADGQIHRAVVADDEVGDVEGAFLAARLHEAEGAEEVFFRAAVSAAIGREVNGHDAAVGPIKDVEGALIFGRELRAITELGASGAADADVDSGEAVWIISGPFAGAGAPAVFAAGDGVVHARGTIPRSAPIPFHIGIEHEDLAIAIESEVVGIAETGAEEVPGFAIEIGANDVAAGSENAGGVAVAIPLAREQVIFLIIAMRRIGGDAFRQAGVVAGHDVEFAIGAEARDVRAVFAVAGKFFQELDVLKLVIALVFDAVEAAGLLGGVFVHDGVDGAVDVGEALGVVKGLGDEFTFGDLAIGSEGDAEEATGTVGLAVLWADDEAAAVVLGHGDPGAFAGFTSGEEFHLEARRGVQRRGRSGRTSGGTVRGEGEGNGKGGRKQSREARSGKRVHACVLLRADVTIGGKE